MDMADKITGSEALMRALQTEGVKTIFGYPGGAIMPVYDALYDYTRGEKKCFEDKERTSFLESNGIKVIRFTNDEIENDISDVLERIRRFINNNSFNLRFQKK